MAPARRRPPASPPSPPEARERGGIWWWLGTILLTALTLYLFSLWGRPYLNVEHEGTVQVKPEDVPQVAAMVSEERLRENVEKLAGFGTRLSGSAGADAAADFLRAELESILGPGSVREELVEVDNPFDLGTRMRVGDEEAPWFRVHPLWAPVVGTYALPEEGRYLGIVRKVSFRRLLRDARGLRGAAVAIRWLAPEDLRTLAMEAVEAGQFKGKLRDPVTSS